MGSACSGPDIFVTFHHKINHVRVSIIYRKKCLFKKNSLDFFTTIGPKINETAFLVHYYYYYYYFYHGKKKNIIFKLGTS